MCVFFLNFVSCFFYSGNSSTYRSLQKKSDRTRCLAVSILEYNISLLKLTRIRSRQSERKRFGFLKEERNSEVIRRVNIGDPAYRIV